MRGDLLLIKHKFDPVGWLIRKATDGNFNHIAWVINKKQIIEVQGKGASINSIRKYSNKFLYETKVLRIKDIKPEKLIEAIAYAISLKLKRKRWTLWKTFLLLFLDSKKELPTLTCSGTIAESLSKVNWFFDKRKKPRNITPEDIARCRRLKEVL